MAPFATNTATIGLALCVDWQPAANAYHQYRAVQCLAFRRYVIVQTGFKRRPFQHGRHQLGTGKAGVVLQNSNGLAIYWTGSNWFDLGSTPIGTELVGTGVFP
ncbi:hypothetical protein [Sandarakinorhabdus sp.]|uniref:hypothetical protein n=1 Tax=Sandarakinorhabdus sp. TaxID=1916663 RepID=UPI00286D6C20|nr:hypothetical protein [Sandarakinorhabdus sp.]